MHLQTRKETFPNVHQNNPMVVTGAINNSRDASPGQLEMALSLVLCNCPDCSLSKCCICGDVLPGKKILTLRNISTFLHKMHDFFSSFFLFTILPNGSNHLGMILVVFLLKLFRLRNLYAQDNFNLFTFLLDYRAKVKIALDESTS